MFLNQVSCTYFGFIILDFKIVKYAFHIILLHFRRQKGRDESIWNVAADYVVNGLLEPVSAEYDRYYRRMDCGIRFTRPKQGCFLKEYDGQSVEELYRMIR